MKHVITGWFLVFGWCSVLLCCACSVDPKKHKDYMPACTPSEERIHGLFCIPKLGGAGGDSGNVAEPIDAGPDATASGDAGLDAGSALDATVPEPCETPDAGGTCYPFDASMTSGQPPCHVGNRVCGADKLWGTCKDPVGPQPETCDGIDNDCDGKTDETQLATCVVGGGVKGACAEDGVAYCRAGRSECAQTVGPMSETCNGKDDDCDGNTDEGLELACYAGATGCTANNTGGFDCVPASTCAPGKLRCVGGQMQTECTDDVRPGTEVATTKNTTPLDEDCDGKIDEGFSCHTGDEFPCYTGPASTRNQSPCKDGKQVCGSNGQFGLCVEEKTPVLESCANEGEDDDCDGTTDDVPRRGASCSSVSTGKGACKENATYQCQAGAEICLDGLAATEVCDSRNADEDCDGTVDEGFDKQTDENNCGTCGNRCASGLTCCGGSCVSTGSSNSNCGMCGNICPPSAQTCCTSNCVNLKTNTNNCGSCGHGCLLGCTNGGCNLL